MLIPGGLEAVALAAIVLIFFFAMGAREASRTTTEEEFYFAGGDATNAQIARGWAAATVSFAVGLFYYMQTTYLFGLWILAVSVGTYLLGNLLFVWVLKKYPFPAFRSIGHLVYKATGSAALSLAIDAASLISLLALLFLELLLGAGIASSILREPSPSAEAFLFICLILLIAGYVCLGGMRAVLASDRWQLTIVRIGIAALVIIGLGAAYLAISQGKWSLQIGPTVPLFSPTIGTVDIVSFLVFGLTVNTLTLFTQTSSWQLAASTEESDRASAVLRGTIQAFTVFAIAIAIATLFRSSGYILKTPQQLFLPASALGTLGTHLLVPLMFAGFLAALISTADTVLLASTLTLSRLLSRQAVRELREDETAELDSVATPEKPSPPPHDSSRAGSAQAPQGGPYLKYFSLSLIVGTLIVLYFVVTRGLDASISTFFVGTIFYMFSHAVVFAPMIIASATSPTRVRSTATVMPLLFGLWLVQTAVSLWAIANAVLKIQFAASVIALALAYLVSVRRRSKADVETELREGAGAE